MPEVQAVSAGAFIDAIGVNTHMNYTDGAYANVANVEADLAYLGIDHIRDSVPNPSGGIPASSQISALETLGAHGVKFDLVSSTAISFSQDIAEIDGLDASTPGSVVAVEGPNEINNWPVTYDGLTGQAAATAFQQALYAAIKGNASTAGVAVYNFTGGLDLPLTVAGVLTPNADGSYTLTNGQTGFAVELPPGVSTVTVTYTGPDSPISGIFGYPGGDQRGSVYYGVNGQIRYSYDNASGATQSLYVDFADYNQTNTLTGVSVTGPGSLTNLVTFDPSQSLAGQADDANIHPYPSDGGAIGGANIAQNLLEAYGSTSPGPTVITETGYNTDPNDPNGVTMSAIMKSAWRGSLPTRGRGSKQQNAVIDGTTTLSLPTRGRGSKPGAGDAGCHRMRSPPARGRGSKHTLKSCKFRNRRSPPPPRRRRGSKQRG